jgi:hypothetical protein
MKKQPHPTQQEILQSLQARVEKERAKLLQRLQCPRLTLEPGPREVELQLAPIVCWKCRKPLAAVRGHCFEDVFVALADVSDTKTVAAFVAELRKQAPGISPLSHRYSKTVGWQYFAAECPWCGALFGSFFMTKAMFPDRLPLNCPYPSCYHQFPDIQCDSFKYHLLTLNIGPQEAEYISEYRGLTKQ